jgi:hypothetical protein
MRHLNRAFVLELAAIAWVAAQPVPLLDSKTKVDWWFAFKFNAGAFPNSCAKIACPFGGTAQSKSYSLEFAYASSANHKLQQGGGCAGETTADPIGATFSQVYNGNYFFVLWNDQFYNDPLENREAPAGHSKGMLAWDGTGSGFVMQVSTPDWPGSGSKSTLRKAGNTLGCIQSDNDIEVSQHFFALKLTKDDVLKVLAGLANSSVVTDPTNKQIVNNGGPSDIVAAVKGLGQVSTSKDATIGKLSSGVTLISKPSHLNVPPWQMVSGLLASEPLRAATWWTTPEIYSTTSTSTVSCWDPKLGKPGAVQIATTGTWNGKSIGLQGGATPEGNHAKIGVSTGTHSYAIFGDENQQGTLSGPNCGSSQNGRGGLFYVVEDATLHDSVRDLIAGQSAPTSAPTSAGSGKAHSASSKPSKNR